MATGRELTTPGSGAASALTRPGPMGSGDVAASTRPSLEANGSSAPGPSVGTDSAATVPRLAGPDAAEGWVRASRRMSGTAVRVPLGRGRGSSLVRLDAGATARGAGAATGVRATDAGVVPVG